MATRVDTGFLVAPFNDGDAHHADARALLTPQGRKFKRLWVKN
jgi:predicted nucleic acid-binding protein